MTGNWKSKLKSFLVSTPLGQMALAYRHPKKDRSLYLTALNTSRIALIEIRKNGFLGTNSRNLKGQSGYEYFDTQISGLLADTLFLYLKRGGKVPNLIEPKRFSDFLILYKFFGRVVLPSPEDKLANESYLPEALSSLLAKHKRPFVCDHVEVPDNHDIEPGTYMWKANHGWGLHCKVTFPIDQKTRTIMAKKAQEWLEGAGNAGSGVWWNNLVKRKVYLERHLGSGKDVRDWKFFVFDGRVEIVQVDTDRHSDHKQNIYDRDFASLSEELYFPRGDETEKPLRFLDMIRVAEGIGRNFEFVRVDLYNVGGEIYLGEIGIAPNASAQPIISDDLDIRLGSAWPTDSVLRRKQR